MSSSVSRLAALATVLVVSFWARHAGACPDFDGPAGKMDISWNPSTTRVCQTLACSTLTFTGFCDVTLHCYDPNDESMVTHCCTCPDEPRCERYYNRHFAQCTPYDPNCPNTDQGPTAAQGDVYCCPGATEGCTSHGCPWMCGAVYTWLPDPGAGNIEAFLQLVGQMWSGPPCCGALGSICGNFCIEYSGMACGTGSVNYHWVAEPLARGDGDSCAEGREVGCAVTQHVAIPQPTFDPNDGPAKVTRQTSCFFLDGVPYTGTLMFTKDFFGNPEGNLGLNPNTGAWETDFVSNVGAGEHSSSMRTWSYSDQAFDVTGYLRRDNEGRFNQADVDALADLVTSDPNLAARWDVDGDGVATAADVALLQTLVDLHLDSGFFGDVDRDGTPDCERAVLLLFGHHLGEAEYRIELDWDLDGDNDDTDLQALVWTFCPPCPGDMNWDGRITFADIDWFVAALAGESSWTHWPYQWRAADCDLDGWVTFADIDPFVALIGTTCYIIH